MKDCSGPVTMQCDELFIWLVLNSQIANGPLAAHELKLQILQSKLCIVLYQSTKLIRSNSSVQFGSLLLLVD